MDGFIEHYNEHHHHRGIRMVMTGQRFRGEDKKVLQERRRTTEEARRRNPDRWINDKALNCAQVGGVWLNPDNGQIEDHNAESNRQPTAVA